MPFGWPTFQSEKFEHVTSIAVRTVAVLLSCVVVEHVAAANAANASPIRGENRWRWTGAPGDMRPLAIRLVRGTFRIVRRSGPVTVDMKVVATDGDPRLVRFDVMPGDTIVIFDVYPSRASDSWLECLPPSSDRGDFGSSDAQIKAVIHAPPSVPVSVEVMEQGAGPAS